MLYLGKSRQETKAHFIDLLRVDRKGDLWFVGISGEERYKYSGLIRLWRKIRRAVNTESFCAVAITRAQLTYDEFRRLLFLVSA